MSYDKEYIRAMEYGMPPISGWGLGIDRFMQFLTSSDNIRDVVLYPLMKPLN
jgi:lysyl-tRNA synthetase class 2